jgi:gamma-glutamyltranspeptidase/glutathione hydrolase
LLARAIELAEKGSDATPELAGAVENTKDVHDQPGFTAQFRPGGQPVKAGQRMTMPLVARTLRQIADGGIDAYYRGSIAERIIADSRRLGGWFEKDDLALHHTRLLEPLRIDYGPPTDGRPGRWWICEQPPPSQGFITLQALAIAQALGLQELPFKDARRVHGLIEAVKLAFADKQRYWADPEKIRLPVAELLAPAYVAQRARAVDLNRTAKYPPGTVRMRDGDTTYLCVADAEGNAVSFIQSIFYSFGSGVVVADTGILLNNRMNGFTTEHGHVNEVAGGKRPVHTLNTYLVYEGSKLRYVGGTPGGDKQVQWNTQMLSALLDHRMTVAEAVAAPRWSIDDDGTVHIESDYGQDVIDGLRARGHRVTVVAPKKGGGAVQLIAVGDAGTKYEAACDPRCRGLAMAE